MLSDVIRRDLLIGKSRAQALELLGPADKDESRYLSYEFEDGNYLSIISVSRLYMILVFDDSGAVVTKVTVADG